MSVLTQVERIQLAKDTLSNYLQQQGIADGTEKVDVLVGKAIEAMSTFEERIAALEQKVVWDTYLSATSEQPVQNKVIENALSGILDNIGNLAELKTTDKSSSVAAINEVLEKSGEPFRVKNWASNTLNVEIPYCTEDLSNGSIAKMVYSIDAVEGADYQIVGMIAYEVFDAASGGNRINCWPVCQFTGNGQKELSVRWACMGTTRKTAKRINAWVLLKHR